MNKILFGTDGWRSKMTEDFTDQNVYRVADGYADYIKKGTIIIGYDCRKNSKYFAEICYNVLNEHGIEVFLCERPIPTPILAYYVSHFSCTGAIMITASHNPPEYNGIKFIGSQGEPVNKNITQKIEEYINYDENIIISKNINIKNNINPLDIYEQHIYSLIDISIIKKIKPMILFNSMHGAAYGLERIFKNTGIKIFSINKNLDPLFGRINPEPTKENLKDQLSYPHLGFAFNGDADRVGVTQNYNYFSPNELFTFLFFYLKERKGDICRTVATTHLVDLIAQECNKKIFEVPVGFKYIGSIMKNQDILIGGEESGGFSFKGHIPSKDGILTALFIIEMFCKQKTPFLTLKKIIGKKYGYRYSNRRDITSDDEIDFKNLSLPKEIIDVSYTDGLKLYLKYPEWILFRKSGTEPINRIYAESDSIFRTNTLLQYGEDFIKKCR